MVEKKIKKSEKKRETVKVKKVSLPKEEYSLLKEKAEKLVACNDSLLRLRAEFENNRKRTEKEKVEFARYANHELIKQLLPVLDNFEHALKNLSKHDKEILNGVKIIYNQFKSILEKEGLEKIKAVGEKFDPQVHHAVLQVESDKHSDDTIIEEMQTGYKLKGKLVRPVMVKVAK